MKSLFLSLTLALALTACHGNNDKTALVPPAPTSAESHAAPVPQNMLRVEPTMLRDLRITTTAVERRAGNDSASLVGELDVNQDAYAVVGIAVSGRVAQIHAALGQSVQNGQVLATVQSPELGKIRGDYLAANSRLDLAQSTLDRKRKLADQKIVAQREVQEAEASVKAAQADLHASLAMLRALGTEPVDVSDGALLAIRSPISGRILDRSIVQGQTVDPSLALFKIANLSRLWLTAHAFERDAVRVLPGTPARITFAALPGQSFEGRISLVGNQVDRDSRTVPLRVEVANTNGLLRPGMSATAFVPLGNTPSRILTVPTASVQRIQEQWFVFLPRGSDTFELRPIGRGRDMGGEVEILSGLQAGETVVVDGAFLLKAEADKSRGEGEHEDH